MGYLTDFNKKNGISATPTPSSGYLKQYTALYGSDGPALKSTQKTTPKEITKEEDKNIFTKITDFVGGVAKSVSSAVGGFLGQYEGEKSVAQPITLTSGAKVNLTPPKLTPDFNSPTSSASAQLTPDIQKKTEIVKDNITQFIDNQLKNVGKTAISLEASIPAYGAYQSGVRETMSSLIANVNPDFAKKLTSMSQPHQDTIVNNIVKFIGQQIPYIPLTIVTEGIVNPITSKLASKVPAGVSIATNLLSNMAKGAIKTGPVVGILSGLTAASPKDRAKNVAAGTVFGGALGAAGAGVSTIASELISKFGVESKSFLANWDTVSKVLNATEKTKYTAEEYAQIQYLNQVGLTGEALKTPISVTVETPAKGKVWDFLRSVFTGKYVPKETPKAPLKMLKAGEHTPDEVISHVVENKLQNTPDGKQLMKVAAEAQKSGQNVVLDSPIGEESTNISKKQTYGYIHNIEKSPNPSNGDQFGQKIEPAGKYMTLTTQERAVTQGKYYSDNKVKNIETGQIEFNNPLVIDATDKTSKQWKIDLSKKYGGKTGKELSMAIIKDGYDGVITMDNGNTSESIHFDRLLKNTTPDNTATINPLIEEAKKYKSEKEFLSVLRENSYTKTTSIPMEIKTEALKPNESLGIVKKTKKIITNPISVVYDVDKNSYRVTDGHHRLAQAIANGQETIPTRVTFTKNNEGNYLTKSKLSEIYNQSKKAKKIEMSEAEKFVSSKKGKLRVKDESKDLVVMHNLSESGIIKANRMGGIPVPSFAVTKNSIPFDDFGDISLIGDQNLAENVYNSDVYSKRVPKEQFKINRKEAESALSSVKEYQKLVGEYGYGSVYEALSDEFRASPKELLQVADRSVALKAMYLKEQNSVSLPEPVMKGASKDEMVNTPTFKELVKNREFEKLSFGTEDFNTKSEKYQKLSETIKKVVDETADTIATKLANGDKQIYKDQFDVFKNIYTEKYFNENGELIFGSTDRFYELLKSTTQKPLEVDDTVMEKKINDLFQGVDKKDYLDWVKNRFSKVYGDSYFRNDSGSKKPYDLENIMNYMVGRVRGQEGFYYGIGSTRSKLAKKFSNVDEIKANKGQLSTDQVAEEAKKALADEFDSIVQDLYDKSSIKKSEDNPFGKYEQVGKALGDVGSSITSRKVESVLSRIQIDYTPQEISRITDFLKRVQTAPVSYFEAKPQRAVKLNEFKMAMVPEGTSKETIDLLIKNGVEVVKYDPKTKGNKEQILKSLSEKRGIAFRLKDDFKKVTGMEMSDYEESQLVELNKKIFGDTDIKVIGQIMANKDALGSYRDGIIEITKGQANAKDTFYHEVVHKVLDTFLTKKEHVDILMAGKEKYAINDFSQIEEKIAEDFINYAKNREGIVGAIKLFFEKILTRIKQYFKNVDKIDKLYQDIVSRNERIKKISIPRDQIPIGKGVEKVSKLEARMKGVLGKATQSQIDELGLSTYQIMNREDTIAESAKYVLDNPKEAMEVLEGKREAPKGQYPESIYVAMLEVAKDDLTLATKLASIQATTMGQRLSLLAEIDPLNPVKIVNDIYKFKEKRVQKTYAGKKVSEVVRREVQKGKEKMKAPKLIDWTSFIEAVEC